MVHGQSDNTADNNSQHSETTEQSCRTSIDEISENNETAQQEQHMVELRQKLMVAENDVYLYKIPPLQTSGGHRYVDSVMQHTYTLRCSSFLLVHYSSFIVDVLLHLTICKFY